MRSGSERSRSMRMTVRPCFASVTAREQPRMPAPTIIASGSCDMKTEIYVGVFLFREFVRPTKLQTTPQLRDDFRKKTRAANSPLQPGLMADPISFLTEDLLARFVSQRQESKHDNNQDSQLAC